VRKANDIYIPPLFFLPEIADPHAAIFFLILGGGQKGPSACAPDRRINCIGKIGSVGLEGFHIYFLPFYGPSALTACGPS
jgi:hypothetical protein